MGFTDDSKNAAVNALTAMGDRISLHNDDPGLNGSSEVTNSGNRQQTTWPPAATGQTVGSECTYNQMPAGAYTHYGVWSSGGSFRWGFPLTPGATLTGTGTLKITPRVAF